MEREREKERERSQEDIDHTFRTSLGVGKR